MPLAARLLWNSLHLLPLVALLAIALAAAVVWLYPAQLRRVKQPWRIVLPALRVTGVLVLAASLLQPVLERLRRAEERGAVLVLVDRSRSMSVIDVSRTPAQLVALADGLGQLPAGVRSRETANLATELDRLRERVHDVASAANDVETAEAFGRGVEAAHARLSAARTAFDRSAAEIAARAPLLPEVGDLRARVVALRTPQTGSTTAPTITARGGWAAEARARIDAAYAAATAWQTDADRKLYESNPQVKSACDELAKRSRWSLTEQALLASSTGLLPCIAGEMPVLAYSAGEGVKPIDFDSAGKLPALPDALESDVVGSVAAALKHAKDRPVRAVVLVSDGRQVGDDDALAAGLAPVGVPVFTVDVAPSERPRDLGFARGVSVPASAFVGETVTIRAPVAATALPAGGTDVQLKSGEVVQSQRVEIRADGTAGEAEFSLRLEHGGPQRIALTLPPVPGEITAENNVAERWVKVLPERMKVAAFAATAGWDFQLLRNALARTPWIRLEAALLDPVNPKVSLTPEQILAQDVIVLSDVSADALDDVQWDAVNRLVRERGGSLFLLAGPDHLPETYTPETIVASALLPYDVNAAPTWRTWPGEQVAFRFLPAPNLSPEQVEALRLGVGPDGLRSWQALSGAFRFIPIPELNSKENTHALLVETDSRAPVLTESFPGNGRVFFLGTNETWRWRYKVGERDHERFWLQLLRYAAGEPYAMQRDLLAIDVDKVAPAPNEPVNVRARILQPDAASYRVHVLRAGGGAGAIVQEQALIASGSNASGRFSATISRLPAGDYVVRLLNPTEDDPAAATLEVPLHVVSNSEAEMADVSGDAVLLRRIAGASGGEFLPLERVGELPALLTAAGAGRSRFFQVSLWDSPLLFLFVVACFAAEWALRKRVGLA